MSRWLRDRVVLLCGVSILTGASPGSAQDRRPDDRALEAKADPLAEGFRTPPASARSSIKVTNLWVNRLIGDAQPGPRKVAWTALPTYRPDAPLRPSGLIGPVTVLTTEPTGETR